MAFDQTTRNRLARFVSDTRTLLTEEFTRQLQNDYGLDPATGDVTDVARLSHLDDARRETARLLRDTMEHYLASADTATPAKAKKARQDVLDRILREQAFTVLNRLCALRMAEARGLLIESIAKGYQSKGFQLYQRLAGTALGETGAAYRLFLFSVFDEFAVDLAVLFDRFSPQGRLFPREAALLAVLEQVNHPDIDPLWTEDETIGWIYQYFNSLEERRQMRAESQAPRNSRELAVRNQFFTPRYVVEFLTDNTLGRIWYEMTKGETGLNDSCRYLVRRPNEIFLDEGQEIPEPDESTENMSQEERLRQTVHIPHRPLKDPRDIRMLDPACGSMHFGLYAFDLFERIYGEAWEIEAARGPGAFNRSEGLNPLSETYSDKEAFLRDVPRLIIERNIHGIDIDPRAVQIAGLSLWLRAQRSWQAQGVKAMDRPQVQRSNIVCAEPMPGESEMLDEFVKQLQPRVLGQLIKIIFEKMKLAGDAGSLLKIEEDIKDAIADAHKEYQAFILRQKKEKGFLPGMAPERQTTLFDFADLPKEEDFWHTVEQRVIDALRDYAETAADDTYQRRLFAADAARGFAFIDICRKRYDAVVMNPPFGECAIGFRSECRTYYPESYTDMLSAFVDRGGQLLESGGLVGAITSRTCFFLSSFSKWRQEVALGMLSPNLLADLGHGVMDAAMVEAAAYVLQKDQARVNKTMLCFRLLNSTGPEECLTVLLKSVTDGKFGRPLYVVNPSSFESIPNAPFSYWVSSRIYSLFSTFSLLEQQAFTIKQGLATADDFRFIRTSWETPKVASSEWRPFAKGGSYSPFYFDHYLQINWCSAPNEIHSIVNPSTGRPRSNIWMLDETIQHCFFRPGITWPRRTNRLSFRALPGGAAFADKGPAIFAKGDDQTRLLALLAILQSSVCRMLIGMQQAGFSLANSFEVGIVKRLPMPEISASDQKIRALADCAKKILNNRQLLHCESITSSIFVAPYISRYHFSISHAAAMLEERVSESKALLLSVAEEIDSIVRGLYGLLSQDVVSTEIAMQASGSEEICADDGTADREENEEEYTAGEDAEELVVATLIEYLIGLPFGRWDLRYATGELQRPELPDSFDPVPLCPLGMLRNAEGLPARPADIPVDYPLRIAWPGILVDEDGHPEDIVIRMRESVEAIWQDRAEAIEQEACEILGTRDLREYIGNPNKLFDDHLKRYTKSRRYAPIYWPLSTPSGSYTLWLYYHRLTDQTLYTCVNDFVEPKLRQVAEEAARLRTKSARSSTEEKELERLSSLELELKDFRDELLRIARFWKPNLNDGVQITAAPLWRLFQHRQWQARLRETWEKLEAGDYDWAHLALSIWPDRVVRASHKDRSYAIAHDLEDRLWHEVEVTRKSKGGKIKKTTEWQPRDLTEADLKTIITEVQAR